MHIMIAPDSFKESLTARQVATTIKMGLEKALPHATFDLMPLGDGGEGTLDALVDHLVLKKQVINLPHAYTQDKLVPYASDGKVAIFEMADICGLEKISPEKRDPLRLTSEGVGEMICHLVKSGIREIYIGVGGSATNDGGLGMAHALGYRFYDAKHEELLPLGINLGLVHTWEADSVIDLSAVSIHLITDVDNPLCGPKGATYIFSGQKGLEKEEFETVDKAMQSFYQQLAPEMLGQKGAGAGGGMAAGLHVFAGAEINSGIDFVLDCLDFDKRVQKADLVIVGEGQMDLQSLSGKAPVGLAARTPKEIPVIAICGSLKKDLPDFPVAGIAAAFSIINQVSSLDEVLKEAESNLYHTALNIGNLLALKLY